MTSITFSEITREKITRPVYLWVEKYIKKLIAEGSFLPGEKMPSERDIADATQISRSTIRKALENLISQGLIERRSSSGTYVRSHPYFERSVGNERPKSLTKGLQRKGSRTESVLLQFSIEAPGEKIATRLSIKEKELVICIRRLRSVSDQPICIETIYIPQALVPGLIAEELVVKELSLYEMLQRRYSIIPSNIVENLRISYATDEEAKLLGLHPMDPVLLLRCITYDTNDRPFEYLVSVNHPDRVVFESTSIHPVMEI